MTPINSHDFVRTPGAADHMLRLGIGPDPLALESAADAPDVVHICRGCNRTHADPDACPGCGALVRGLYPDETPDLDTPEGRSEWIGELVGWRSPFDARTLPQVAADTLHGWRADECLL